MKGAVNLSWISIILGYLILIVPLLLFKYYKLNLIKDSIIAILRMTTQLYLLGFYLEYIFKLDSILLNITWIIIMIIVSVSTTIKKSKVVSKYYFIPLLLSLTFVLFLTLLYFIGIIIGKEYFFNSRYLIPIVGILLGNSISSNIIVLNSFNSKLKSEYHLYQFAIGNGASKYDALLPFISHSLKQALSPIIASMAVIGLISIPGMMTGQILGGSSPLLAIKYQIVTMISIFFAQSSVVVLTLNLTNRFIFDEMGNLRK
jgi:putative ABC transport system permease protein